MDSSVNYTTKPSKEQLEEDFNRFIAKDERFSGMLKIGKTFLETIVKKAGFPFEARYDRNDKYEALTVDHVFARCATEQLALEVEKMAQDYCKEKNICIPGSDVGGGRFVAFSQQKKFDAKWIQLDDT